jgi:hypothetical protein
MMLNGVFVGALNNDEVIVRSAGADLLHEVAEPRDLGVRLERVAERRHLRIIGELGRKHQAVGRGSWFVGSQKNLQLLSSATVFY